MGVRLPTQSSYGGGVVGSTVRVPGRCQVGFAEFGAPDGAPILFFHGIPGSRLLGRVLHDKAIARGARIVALERPGCGLSGYCGAPTVADCARHFGHAADALGIERFSALGVSGGGPYALACGRLFPERVDAVGVVSGLGPENATGILLLSSRVLVALGRLSPLLPLPPIALARRQTARRLADVLEALEVELRAEGVDDPWAARFLLADLLEAFASGSRGVAADCARVRRWGFAPEDVSVPVDLWHGRADRHVSVTAAEELARRLPDCRAHFVPGEGHLGVLPRHADEALEALSVSACAAA